MISIRQLAVVLFATLAALAAGCVPDVTQEAVNCPLVSCAPVNLTTFQPADVVIGQPDFLTNTTPTGAAINTIWANEGSPFFDGTNLYIGDGNDNRVVGFSGLPTVNGPNASFVLGQGNNFTTNGASATPTGMSSTTTVFETGGKLFVTDNANNRILIYNTPPTADIAADVAVGQTTLSSGSAACTQSGLNFPRSAIIAGGRLIVADANGHRIMIWNSVPTTNGVNNADLVLGQTSFTSCTANAGGSVGSGTLQTPAGVWSDGTRLVVADWINNRVLIWNNFPTSNGQSADIVLGQGNGGSAFTNNAASSGSAGLNSPAAVESNGIQLFVADDGNNRVLVWNSFPTQVGQSADVVLGQTDASGSGVNAGGAVGASTLDAPFGLRLAGTNALLVSDAFNNRVLVFRGH